MKTRRFVICFLVLLLLAAVPVTALASGVAERHVQDYAGLLTEPEIAQLEKRAAGISREYKVALYVIVIPDFRSQNYSSIERYCTDFYDGYGLGIGSEHTGAVMMLSMADRDFVFDYNGSGADEAFTERARDKLEDDVLPALRQNDFYGAFNHYLDSCEDLLQRAAEGKPYGSEKTGMGVFAAIPGAIAALFGSMILRAPMKSAHLRTNANAYVVQGSLNLTRQNDQFLHRTVTRQPRQTNNNNSGGSHHYSSGSHSGRSGKF